ncbi:NAD(P)H-dependent oxidoreductase [Hydrogenimonas sp.]|uniref:NAD(P)H-dependent oxidoreductase n=1 Tax=Hydrogenimonas sp. TaxID=2231112 RepID=UPI00261627A9|nr:NAD(P)H-dependent oxidoreductase [Hydrogenimonas sp.]
MERIEFFMQAMQERHACKRFDTTKKIPDRELETILEIGRLSPSSFGMEPWRFLVVRDPSLKEALRPFCWDQPQITECSDLVVVKTIVASLAPGSDYPRKMLSRRDLPEEKIEAYVKKYDQFSTEKFRNEGLACWGTKQCYIASANMMTGAMAMGIDSCAIEGFEKEKVEALLDMDVARESIALILAFGYRVNEPPSKVRLPLGEIVEYR